MAVPTHNSDENSSSSGEKDHTASVSKPKKPCNFCGSKSPHLRRNCSARNALCFKCQKKGHFSKRCKSQRSPAAASPSSFQQRCAIKTAPSCLSYSTIKSFVQGHELSTMIDSGSSMSFIIIIFFSIQFISQTQPSAGGLQRKTNWSSNVCCTQSHWNLHRKICRNGLQR